MDIWWELFGMMMEEFCSLQQATKHIHTHKLLPSYNATFKPKQKQKQKTVVRKDKQQKKYKWFKKKK